MERRGKRKAYSSYSYGCGEFPEDGAIFMSSRATRQECIDRNLFGLPMASADFVKAVRSGMTLFLFEYESRELYGVFEAVSDGQLDINPHAWSSSSQKKTFPAQVRVRVISDCHPIPESVFGNVISDNYYQKNKFNFGLSRQQVDRLLQLFIPRTRPEKPLRAKKATIRQTITSGDLRELITSQGKRDFDEHEEFDEFTTVSRGIRSDDEQVKDYPAVLGDYIPLSPISRCDVEINVKAVYSIKSEHERGGMIPRLNLLKSPEASRDVRRRSVESDLVPHFVRQAENATCEADRPVNDEYQDSPQRHKNVRKRVSVFSRLTFA